MKVYNKLIRDNIPKIIQDAGKKCSTRILDQEEYLVELRKKLIEESSELVASKTIQEVIEEMADIYELLETILIEEKIDLLEIKKRRIQKNMEKGSFEEKVFLKNVSE